MVWDYQTKQCIYTFDAHEDNISAVAFHPDLPLIISCAEDNQICVWNSMTYKQEKQLYFGFDRVWALHALKESNLIALGFDEGTVVIKIGKEAPNVDFRNGKVVWAKNGDVSVSNLKTLNQKAIQEGEFLSPVTKELGSSEIYAQDIKFSPNGRYFTMVGESDYVIYSTLKFVNSGFGSALDFEWSQNNDYAIRTDTHGIKIYKNLTECKTYKTDFKNTGIFGGKLLGVCGDDFISFYDWDTFSIVRKIELPSPKEVHWSENGDFITIVLEEQFYVLKYNEEEAMDKIQSNVDEDGVETAFTLIGDFNHVIASGRWIQGDVFVFTTDKGKLNYLIGDKILNLSLIDKKLFILGYIPNHNRIYLINKGLKIVSYQLLTSVLKFQKYVMIGQPEQSLKELTDIPESMHVKMAQFLEQQGLNEHAFKVTPDLSHKFELALTLNKIQDAFDIATELGAKDKFKKIGDISLSIGNLGLAEKCFKHSEDLTSLLLLY